jgi:hypothetical protein
VTDYVLKISSFSGIVPGAHHFRGRVEGPYPRSCHGGKSSRGNRWYCEENHEIPDHIKWDVDALWSEADYDRYQASDFELDGPGQFTDETQLIDAAIRRFNYEREPEWWEEKYPSPQPGDRLYLRWLPSEVLPDDEAAQYPDAVTSKDVRLLAEIPAPHRESELP